MQDRLATYKVFYRRGFNSDSASPARDTVRHDPLRAWVGPDTNASIPGTAAVVPRNLRLPLNSRSHRCRPRGLCYAPRAPAHDCRPIPWPPGHARDRVRARDGASWPLRAQVRPDSDAPPLPAVRCSRSRWPPSPTSRSSRHPDSGWLPGSHAPRAPQLALCRPISRPPSCSRARPSARHGASRPLQARIHELGRG